MYDIFFVSRTGKNTQNWKSLKSRFPLAKKISNNRLEDIAQKSFTKFFWVVFDDLIVESNFDFSYIPDEGSQNYIHVFRNGIYFDGICLIPTHALPSQKEFEHRFFVNKKEINLQASLPNTYDLFEIETYNEYKYALENSTTEMFWMSSPNIKANQEVTDAFYFPHHNTYDRSQNHAFVHKVNGEKYYNGLFLCSKKQPLTRREVEHRFPVNRKEWNLIGSTKKTYDLFEIDNFEDYEHALENSTTEMFWAIPNNVKMQDDFKFDFYFNFDNYYDRSTNHAFLNGHYHDGVMLLSKKRKISKRELEYGFIVDKKEHNLLASKPKPFDIVFISYNEPNADENFEKLRHRFPYAKRVHGVSGIHNAHIEAARKVETEMFWVVDGDADINAEFNFDFQVPKWDHDVVHVWRSKNPVNELVYGYGGVKLLPTQMTVEMNKSKPDMTTSISNRFRLVEEISNITVFNTDSFNAWKSGFRECAKLSSRLIDRQEDKETIQRLETWCNVGTTVPYGIDAIRGAKQGKSFGEKNKHNLDTLYKLNDFNWLYEQFSKNSF